MTQMNGKMPQRLRNSTLLEGEALSMWLELTTEEKASYVTSEDKIIAKMTPVRFVSLNDFRV